MTGQPPPQQRIMQTTMSGMPGLRLSYVEFTSTLDIPVAYKNKGAFFAHVNVHFVGSSSDSGTLYTKTHAKGAIPVFRHVDFMTEGQEMRDLSTGS